MAASVSFTNEQRAIISHGDGPAAVIAGAGTGKTTVLAHRVHRLVREQNVSPTRILVCSFSRATVDDLRSKIADLGISGVHVKTLHALGRALLPETDDRPRSSPDAPPSPSTQSHRLAKEAIAQCAGDRGIAPSDLGYTPSALSDRIAAWKHALAYSPEAYSALPAEARRQAQPVEPDDDDLQELFQRFEDARQKRGWQTYADMLRTGWERLATDSDHREVAQSRYRYVMVDEFQDLSRAQFYLLDLLTKPHRNYMAVGDEDQCIYGWRGADPSFLLSFRDRYDAEEYTLSASFRSPASSLVLANAVIEQNDDRRPTRLRCTQGITGRTKMLTPADLSAEADTIAERIRTLQTDGTPPGDIAVLVRTYGQTAPLERALTEHNVAYRLDGAAPFYRRRAVRTLFQYLFWALLERDRRQNGWFADEGRAAQYTDRFARILKAPTRYIPHERIHRIAREAQQRRTPVLSVLRAHRSALPEPTQERVNDFLDTANALVDRVDENPADVLRWLVDRIDYQEHLQETSALSHLADARMRSVRSAQTFAERHASVAALLSSVQSIATQRQSDAPSVVTLQSIHRAKGQEWPVVFIPGCVDTIYPLSGPDAQPSTTTAEERRLLYVAMTRAQQQLYLSCPSSHTQTSFLTTAEAEARLRTIRSVRRGLRSPPDALSESDLTDLCQGLISLHLESYIKSWWTPSEAHRQALRRRLEPLSSSIRSAHRRRQAYRQSHADWAARKRKAADEAEQQLQEWEATVGAAPVTGRLTASSGRIQKGASLSFEWDEANSTVTILWDDRPVGTLSPLDGHRLDAATVLNLPWPRLQGTLKAVHRGRGSLSFSIDWASSTQFVRHQTPSPSPPDTLPEEVQALCDDAFRAGYNLLRRALGVSHLQV